MDVQMPEMGGLEATARIRQLPAPASSTPIIGVTANAIDGDRERCIGAGMNSYLSKPFRADELARMLLEYAAPAVTEFLP